MLIEDKIIRKMYIETEEDKNTYQKYLDKCYEKGTIQSVERGLSGGIPYAKITIKERKEIKGGDINETI